MAKETFSSLIDLFKSPSSSSVSTLMCDVCGNKLSVFRKKKPCAECKRQFCSQCLQRCRDRALRCKNCCVLTMRPPHRAALLDLRAKDLQHYLTQHNVSTRGCLEKEDLVNVLLRYAGTPGNPPPGNVGNPGNSSNSRYPPTGNSSFISGNSENRAGNSGTGSSVTVTIATTSASTSVRTLEPASVQTQFAQNVSGHGDSDSSSDTSFEIVQRPGSIDNITSVHSSSSSTSVSEKSSPADTSSSTVETTGVPPLRPERESENPEGSETTADAPMTSTQHSADETLGTLGSISLTSPVNLEGAAAPDIVVDPDIHNVDSQEGQRVHPLSQPVSQANSSNNSSNNSPNLLRGTMASITSEADFEALSVKSLKDILHRHRVNYHGCCEKAELVDRAKRLYRDYCTSRAELEKLELDALCKICMDAPVECVMLECGHMATCTDCGRQLSECPICRQFVVRIVRTFKA